MGPETILNQVQHMVQDDKDIKIRYLLTFGRKFLIYLYMGVD